MDVNQILYEDQDCIVCRKPAGIPTQSAKMAEQDMVSLLKNYRVSKKEPSYLGVCHRLDQPVEGIMVFAKNKEAAAFLSGQVANSRSIGGLLTLHELVFRGLSRIVVSVLDCHCCLISLRALDASTHDARSLPIVTLTATIVTSRASL